MRLSQCWLSGDYGGGGGVCLGLYVISSPLQVLISRAWAWRETTAGPEPKQTDSWSARRARQRQRVRETHTNTHRQTHTNTHKHTHMQGSFCWFRLSQFGQTPFHTKRWKCLWKKITRNDNDNLNRRFLCVQLRNLFIPFTRVLYKPMSNNYWLKWRLHHFMCGCFDITWWCTGSLCGHRTGPGLSKCHNCSKPPFVKLNESPWPKTTALTKMILWELAFI